VKGATGTMKESQSLFQARSSPYDGTEPVHGDCILSMQSGYGYGIMLCPGFIPLSEEGFHRFKFIHLRAFRGQCPSRHRRSDGSQ
jgi:hypothetical protein